MSVKVDVLVKLTDCDNEELPLAQLDEFAKGGKDAKVAGGFDFAVVVPPAADADDARYDAWDCPKQPETCVFDEDWEGKQASLYLECNNVPREFLRRASQRFPLLRFRMDSLDREYQKFDRTVMVAGARAADECVSGDTEYADPDDFSGSEAEDVPLEPRAALGDTAFAEWCEETGFEQVYEPRRKKARTSPDAEAAEAAEQ